jgi:serine/threonine protein kinase
MLRTSGHYHAYTTGKVLHRDLSENNLMFDQLDGETIKGILNDWDMASLLDDVGEVPISTARHRTGTIPFMAIDLLQAKPPIHLYRHDLESFFYILVWAAINYDLKRNKRCAPRGDIEYWDSNLTNSARNKESFIMNIDTSTEMLSHVQPGFEEVAKEWIQPLIELFRLGRTARLFPSMALAQPFDHTTYGGHVTFHNFMKALGRTPRNLPKLPTTAP